MIDNDTFTSVETEDSFKTIYQLNGDSRCIMYFVMCKQCWKQYTAETTDNFKNSWKNHNSISNKFDRSNSCMKKRLYRHFSSPGYTGFLKDVSVTLINKTLKPWIRP